FRKTGADRHRRVRVEYVGGVEVRNALVGLAERRDFHVGIDAEQVANLCDLVGRGHQRLRPAFGLHVGNIGHDYALGDGRARLNVQPTFGGSGNSVTKRCASAISPVTSIRSRGAPPWITAATVLGSPLNTTAQFSIGPRSMSRRPSWIMAT